MNTGHADMSNLRAIGARAFVYVEVHTTKIDDKAWEGKLCGFSSSRRSYRIYNADKGTIVKSRKITFLETPPNVRLKPKYQRHHDELVGQACTNGAIYLASLTNPIVLGLVRGASTDEFGKLREEIEGMLRDNEARNHL